MRYAIMVNGEKTPNTTGISQVSNAVLKRNGLISHQMNIAILGPKRNKDVIMQHIGKG